MASNAIAPGGYFVKTIIKKFGIDLKWPEMRSKMAVILSKISEK